VKGVLSLLFGCGFALLLLTLGVSKEVPVGSLTGSVTLHENGKPLVGALVVISPETKDSDDEEDEARTHHARTDADGHFNLNHVASGDYRVEVVAKNHELDAVNVTIPEGGRASLQLDLRPAAPHLQIYASQKVMAPQVPGKLELVGFSPGNEFKLDVRKLSLTEITQAKGIREAVIPDSDQLSIRHLASLSSPVWSGEIDIRKKDAEGAFEQSAEIPKLDEGLYVVSASGSNLTAGVVLNVTRLALITKTVNNRALCYTTDIDTGQPVADVAVGVSLKPGNQINPLARTDRQGLATVQLSGSQISSMVVAQKGSSLAISEASLSPAPASQGPVDPNVRVFTYADRPIYRPGDTVQFKSIVRRLHGDELVLPGTGTATVKLTDPQDNLLQTIELPISGHGTLHGSFTTNPEAAPGVYQIEVSALGGVDTYYANLAAYRKPDYSVKVTPEKPQVAFGDSATAVVDCQYFFGGPVVGAKVTAQIYRSPEWKDFGDEDVDDASEESSDDSFQGGENVETLEAVTDGLGKAHLQFATNGVAAADSLNDYRYTIQASVEGSGNRTFEGSGSFLVTRGAYDLSLATDPGFLSLGETASVIVKTNGFSPSTKGVPGKPIAGRTVKVRIEQETCTTHAVVHEAVQTASVVTDSTGVAKFQFKPSQSGNFRIRGSTQDDQGREIQSETDLYVEGGATSELENAPHLDVRLNRKRYSTGEVAKALITTADPGGVALLTVESDTVKKVFSVALHKGSAIVKIPVDKTMSPNAFVSVAYVCHRKYAESTRKLVVSRNERALSVSVISDQPKALPGANVTFRIKTATSAGRGVPANVSLGLVDESIYAIKKDTTDIRSSLFPQKEDLIQTTYSFPEIYLDGGDKAGGSVPIRRKFLDTASWIPEIETDSSGNATVKVKLPDNLTSWRATGVAATDDSAVGATTTNVVASKPLMVRVLTPRFMVVGDEQEVSAAVTNDSGQELKVKFTATANRITLKGQSSNSLLLAAGQTENVSLPLSAAASGDAKLVATVVSDKGYSDAMEAKLNVRPHARLQEDSQSGIANGSKGFDFSLEPTYDPNAGGLEVTITPSIASGLVQSLDQLVQFPYGCVEQTLSRFLPAISVVDAIKGTSLATPTLTARSKKIAADGFARLRKMQHSDGGWGWWSYDDSDMFLTGWVLDGLLTAKRCGVETPTWMNVSGALDWSEKRLGVSLKTDELDSKLYLALALAEYQKLRPGKELLASLELKNCTAGQRALASLLADAVHDSSFRDKVLDRLIQDIDEDALDFSNRHAGGFGWWSEDEQAALVLRAVSSLRPNDSTVPKLAIRLQGMKRWDGWLSTRATTMATLAMCDYIRRHPLSLQAGTVSVLLNDAPYRTLLVDPAKPNLPSLRFTIPISKLSAGKNRLTIQSRGVEPYLAADLRQYVIEPFLSAVSGAEALTVSRRYFKMEPTRLQDGSLKLLPSKKPITQFSPGDIIRCQLIVHSDARVDFLQLEDPLPSNCEVTDREDPMEGAEWSFWYSDLTIRDDRVAMFARYMPRGDNVFNYTMRAEGYGAAAVLPTHVSDMYAPQVTASGEESKLEVSR
jgi:uncharacterized protein YfaS (alpha-2-macroglobulin family)